MLEISRMKVRGYGGYGLNLMALGGGQEDIDRRAK